MNDEERSHDMEPTLQVRIEEAEWADIGRRLRPSLEGDERDRLGNFGLVLGGGRRRWFSTDSYRLVVIDTGPDEGDLELVVSPRLLAAFPLVSAGSGSALLSVRGEPPHRTVSLEGPGGALTLDHGDLVHVDLDEILDHQLLRSGTSFTADVEALHEMVRLARVAPAGPFLDEDRIEPLMWLTASRDALHLEVGWGELGSTRYHVPVDGTGEATISANPSYLTDLIESLEPGPATFTIPDDINDTVRVQQGHVTGLLMPIDPHLGTVRHIEHVLATVFGDDALHLDDDGCYPLTVDGARVRGRIIVADPIRLEISASVIDDVEVGADLLEELNALNASTGMAKVLWRDGRVDAVGELVATTLDPEEVVAVLRRVSELADGLGPALAARFGGRPQLPGFEARWADYGRALLHAELVPGEWLPLNGPDATEAFPFTSPVYVITAHNPRGRARPDDTNEQDNARLAAALLLEGAHLVHAVGGSPDGAHEEASFLVWNIDEEAVLRLGADFGQDAVFELTRDHCTILGVTVPRRQERPRCSPLPG
jgi:hypothetical protein